MNPRNYRLVHPHGCTHDRLGQGAKGIVPGNLRSFSLQETLEYPDHAKRNLESSLAHQER